MVGFWKLWHARRRGKRRRFPKQQSAQAQPWPRGKSFLAVGFHMWPARTVLQKAIFDPDKQHSAKTCSRSCCCHLVWIASSFKEKKHSNFFFLSWFGFDKLFFCLLFSFFVLFCFVLFCLCCCCSQASQLANLFQLFRRNSETTQALASNPNFVHNVAGDKSAIWFSSFAPFNLFSSGYLNSFSRRDYSLQQLLTDVVKLVAQIDEVPSEIRQELSNFNFAQHSSTKNRNFDPNYDWENSFDNRQPQFPEPQPQFPPPQFPEPQPQFPPPQFPEPQPQFPPPQFPGLQSQFPQPQFPELQSQFPELQSQFPQPQFPEPQPQFPEPQPQFPEPQPQFPEPQPQFPEPQPQFPEPQPQFPEHPQSPEMLAVFVDMQGGLPNRVESGDMLTPVWKVTNRSKQEILGISVLPGAGNPFQVPSEPKLFFPHRMKHLFDLWTDWTWSWWNSACSWHQTTAQPIFWICIALHSPPPIQCEHNQFPASSQRFVFSRNSVLCIHLFDFVVQMVELQTKRPLSKPLELVLNYTPLPGSTVFPALHANIQKLRELGLVDNDMNKNALLRYGNDVEKAATYLFSLWSFFSKVASKRNISFALLSLKPFFQELEEKERLCLFEEGTTRLSQSSMNQVKSCCEKGKSVFIVLLWRESLHEQKKEKLQEEQNNAKKNGSGSMDEKFLQRRCTVMTGSGTRRATFQQPLWQGNVRRRHSTERQDKIQLASKDPLNFGLLQWLGAGSPTFFELIKL